MIDNREGQELDWSIDLGVPGSVPSSEAQSSLRKLSILVGGCTSFEDLLPSSEQVNALVRDAVAGGATEQHIAAHMRLGLEEAEALVHGVSFDVVVSPGPSN